MPDILKPYAKTIAAVVTAALGWSAVVIASEPAAIAASEWQLGGVMLAGALGVYLIPNTPAA